MKFYRTIIFVFISLFALQCGPSATKVYKIDSQEKFNELCLATFRPGDVIMFQRGKRFTGMFSPAGSGNEKAPIRIDVYGEGERPRIDALGENKAGLLLRDPSFWEVNGLEITNTDGTDNDQGQLIGIYVLADSAEGVYQHVYINNCYIHDVNGKVAGKQRGGIHVHIKELEASRFHDLRITNNRIFQVGGVGIGNSSSCGLVEFSEQSTVNHNLWTNVYVADNYVDFTGRNNIIARVSKDAIYERNVLANSSRYSTGHSIFCFNTDGIKIQYNEAYGNVGEGGRDRGGFDADYNCVNTYIQYNYSHDNHWFCGIMKRPTRNVIIRYNVSQNDTEGIYFYGFENAKAARDIHIYNNTHYVCKGLDVQVFPEGRTPLNSLFENNIFYFEGQGHWGDSAKGINTLFRNNLYYNITPHKSDVNPKTADPLFSQPGITGTNIDLKTMSALSGYRPKPGSPCNQSGVTIKDNGGQDLLKTKLQNQTIGAFAAIP
jgi:hypothetical protein